MPCFRLARRRGVRLVFGLFGFLEVVEGGLEFSKDLSGLKERAAVCVLRVEHNFL